MYEYASTIIGTLLVILPIIIPLYFERKKIFLRRGFSGSGLDCMDLTNMRLKNYNPKKRKPL